MSSNYETVIYRKHFQSIAPSFLFATNLIVNGDAETGLGSASGYDIEPVQVGQQLAILLSFNTRHIYVTQQRTNQDFAFPITTHLQE